MIRPLQSNTQKRLILGFCTLISIFLLFGVYTLYDIHRISQLTRIIYNHPLAVSNAALQANISIVKMHRSMKDVVLFHTLSKIQQSIEIVNDEEKRVYRQLDIVKDNILGDEGKILENEARKLFDAWRLIRNEVIGLVDNDQRENAANITIGKGASHVALLEIKMFGLLNYAKGKASEFNNKTEKIVSVSNVVGIFLLLLGILVSILVVFTTLKRTSLIEKKLIESETQYRRLFETANDGILLFEKSKGEIARTNSSASEMFGYQEEECIGRKMKDIGFPDEFDSFEKILQILSKDGIIHYKDIPLLKKDGQAFDADIYMVNKASLLQCNVRDITEKKREEKALRESETKYRLMFNCANDAIFIHRPTKDRKPEPFSEVNEIACKMYGYSREEFLELSPMDLIASESIDEITSLIKKVISDGHAVFQVTHKTKEGKLFPVEISAFLSDLYRDNTILSIVRDITDRKKAEGELKQAQKMESIGTLAGGIAHDFNNILSAIIGYTELAIDGVAKGTELEDDLREVHNGGMRAKNLVKQILTFARQSDEEVKPIQLNIIVKEVLKFIRSSIPTNIQIKDEIISDSFIMGSPTHIHQILMNLCTNSSQAMEEDGGTLKVSLNDVAIGKMAMGKNLDLLNGDYIEIKVSDTGIGIPSRNIHNIFEPYFTTKKIGEGTGMGLSVVHGIVESYGGKITVDSTMGKGTVFTIYLPISKKRIKHDSFEEEVLPIGKEHILFVDDEAPISKMGSRVLEQLGYTVTSRTSSVEALELFRTKPKTFDLVITDMTMPNMTGDKLAVELIKIRPDIPVVLCTGYSKKMSEESASEIGIKAFAYKPIVKADLAKTIRKVLDEANDCTHD
jgi:PAS domain S-box-containing protein